MAAEQAPVWSHIEHRSDSALLIAGLGLGAGDWNWLLLRFWFRVLSSDGPERFSSSPATVQIIVLNTVSKLAV